MTGRVFSTVAGIKVAGSSIGVALAGIGAHLGASTLILLGAGVCAVTAAAMALDAGVSKLRRPRPDTDADA
jgi:hypothetical protein